MPGGGWQRGGSLPAAPRLALSAFCCWYGAAAVEEEEDEYFRRCSHVQRLATWRGTWPGGCLVHAPQGDGGPRSCNRTCTLDFDCSLWQYAGARCLVSRGSCEGGEGENASGAQAGELVQHGTAGVAQELPAGVEVRGLLPLGDLSGGQEGGEPAELCRQVCYADRRCGYWQYGNGSCRVERQPDFSASPDNLTVESDLAFVGEQVVRGCPHAPHPIWLSVGMAGAGLGSLAFAWAACQGEGVTREVLLKEKQESQESESFLSGSEDSDEVE